MRLILIRHAKSGWDDPFADDHARTLTERGVNAATAIGRWLNASHYIPDVVLCSDAARTIETSELILNSFDPRLPIKFDKTLYHASPDTLLELANSQTVTTVAMIAHNPGIGMLANALVSKKPRHHRFSDYPTCATTVIDFADRVELGRGQLVDFTVPRDLG